MLNTLKEGTRGPQVELLQASLKRAEFYSGTIDGIFGPMTKRAVNRFQTSRGLKPDGIVGHVTWAKLMPYLTGYVIHRIRAGNTLYKIASAYGTTVAAIQTANPGINPNQLTVGQSITVPFGFPVIMTNVSMTSTALSLFIEGLVARYPFLQKGSIGNSVTGKPLYTLSIGKGQNQVFYNAAHHANEWITTPVLMKFLEQYAQAYARGGVIGGKKASEIYEQSTIYIAPMVNPDGVDLVTGEIPPDSELYKQAKEMNYLSLPFPSGWKANIKGVDLNLNYPAGWEEAKRIKYAQGYTKPGPRDFVGPSPLSEPESQAVAAFTRQQDFRLILAYHTQGEIIYWKFADYNPPRSFEIAQMFGEVSGYTVEETPAASGNAGYKDWFIQTYNRPGYTIEVGRGISPLPLSQFDKIYNDNLGILTLAAVV